MATMEVKISPEDVKASQSDLHVPDPTVVVIFGASGDLTKRKLLPALFHLEQAGLLPPQFEVVGVARRPLQDEFANDMRDGIVQLRRSKAGRPQAGRLSLARGLPRDELRRQRRVRAARHAAQED